MSWDPHAKNRPGWAHIDPHTVKGPDWLVLPWLCLPLVVRTRHAQRKRPAGCPLFHLIPALVAELRLPLCYFRALLLPGQNTGKWPEVAFKPKLFPRSR